MSSIAFTAPHHQAAEVGYSLLRQGASAIDAMVAAAAAISVVYPHMNSLGGDGFWLIHRPGEAPVAIDACGVAAAAATPDYYQGFDAIPSRGPKAALTLAGTLDGWRLAREWQDGQGIASLPFAELMAPAAQLARNGITVTTSLQLASEKVAAELGEFPGYRAVFRPDGSTLKAGDTLPLPSMAALLDTLAEQGTEGFYRGALARELARWLQAEGSPLTLQDLNAYRAQLVEPLSVQLDEVRIFNLPPPTQGLASLLILAIYDALYAELKPDTEAAHIHLLVESCKQAFVERDRLVADPSRLPEGWRDILEAPAIGKLAAQVDPAAASPWPRPANPGDTVWMGAMDAEGCSVSFIQSIYWEFGSGLVHPDYGMSWNNRGTGFSLRPGHLNVLEPGCKPFHTLNPAYALFGDGRRLAYGTMGGEGQPQTQAAVLSRYHYQRMNLEQAVARGRWLLGRTWGDPNSDLKLERDLADAVGAELAALGHSFRVVPARNEMMGHAGAVLRHPDGRVEAASDPRSDGAALA